jgi:hypothetical protein
VSVAAYVKLSSVVDIADQNSAVSMPLVSQNLCGVTDSTKLKLSSVNGQVHRLGFGHGHGNEHIQDMNLGSDTNTETDIYLINDTCSRCLSCHLLA